MVSIYGFYQTAFTSKKDFGKESREAAWAAEQRTLHGLQSTEGKLFAEKNAFRDINLMAEEAKRRAEIARSVFTRCSYSIFMVEFWFFLAFLQLYNIVHPVT